MLKPMTDYVPSVKRQHVLLTTQTKALKEKEQDVKMEGNFDNFGVSDGNRSFALSKFENAVGICEKEGNRNSSSSMMMRSLKAILPLVHQQQQEQAQVVVYDIDGWDAAKNLGPWLAAKGLQQPTVPLIDVRINFDELKRQLRKREVCCEHEGSCYYRLVDSSVYNDPRYNSPSDIKKYRYAHACAHFYAGRMDCCDCDHGLLLLKLRSPNRNGLFLGTFTENLISFRNYMKKHKVVGDDSTQGKGKLLKLDNTHEQDLVQIKSDKMKNGIASLALASVRKEVFTINNGEVFSTLGVVIEVDEQIYGITSTAATAFSSSHKLEVSSNKDSTEARLEYSQCNTQVNADVCVVSFPRTDQSHLKQSLHKWNYEVQGHEPAVQQTVRKIDRFGDEVFGTIRKVFKNNFVVEGLDGVAFVTKGDSGAGVFDMDNKLVGFIIGTFGEPKAALVEKAKSVQDVLKLWETSRILMDLAGGFSEKSFLHRVEEKIFALPDLNKPARQREDVAVDVSKASTKASLPVSSVIKSIDVDVKETVAKQLEKAQIVKPLEKEPVVKPLEKEKASPRTVTTIDLPKPSVKPLEKDKTSPHAPTTVDLPKPIVKPASTEVTSPPTAVVKVTSTVKPTTTTTTTTTASSSTVVPKLNLKVTVEKAKGAVYVQSWGEPPFAHEPRDDFDILVPDKFRVISTSNSRQWIGETKIVETKLSNGRATYKALYKFSYLNNPIFCSDWRDTPTRAYREALAATEKRDISTMYKGANGRLIIGVSYRNVQELIHKNLGTEIYQQLGREPVLQPLSSRSPRNV